MKNATLASKISEIGSEMQDELVIDTIVKRVESSNISLVLCAGSHDSTLTRHIPCTGYSIDTVSGKLKVKTEYPISTRIRDFPISLASDFYHRAKIFKRGDVTLKILIGNKVEEIVEYKTTLGRASPSRETDDVMSCVLSFFWNPDIY